MGYYTRYELTLEDTGKYNTSDIVSYMKEMYKESGEEKFYPFSYDFDDYIGLDKNYYLYMCSDECKWYDHTEEMLEMSKRFPNAVFCLYGVGEESEDIWYTYYKNGKSQYCPAKIVFDEYDESRLA